MQMQFPYTIFPLGDTAVTIDFGNIIDPQINETVMALYDYISAHAFKGFIEAVPAYSSLTIIYEPLLLFKTIRRGETIYELVKEKTEALISCVNQINKKTSRIVKVPVCYDDFFAKDMPMITAQKKIMAVEVIRLHSAVSYRVYMLGFLPGFAYMGEIDERIVMPRKPVPQKIVGGSVGITGKQTGIYPMDSPGGWNIIGRTPVSLFEKDDDTVKTFFQPGDTVQFYPISRDEFENY